MGVEIRIFRGDEILLGATYFLNLGLDYLNTNDDMYWQKSGNYLSAGGSLGIDIAVRHADGSETAIASKVAVVTKTATFSGLVSVTYTPPQTALLITDRIVIRVYGKFGIDAWVLGSDSIYSLGSFVTEALGATQLDSVEWTVYYFMVFSYSSTLKITYLDFYFDGHLVLHWDSRIENFSWSVPVPSALKMYGDGLTCVVC